MKKKCNQSKHFRVQKQLLSCCVLIPTRGKHSDSGHVFKDDNTTSFSPRFFQESFRDKLMPSMTLLLFNVSIKSGDNSIHSEYDGGGAAATFKT